MIQLAAMREDLVASEKDNRSMRLDLDASEKDGHSMRSKMTVLKLKLTKTKSERDRATERGLINAQDRAVLERLMRVNTIVSSGTAMIDGSRPRSKSQREYMSTYMLQTQAGGGAFVGGGTTAVSTVSTAAALDAYYRGNHPGSSKFMRCVQSIPATGPGTMECQFQDIVYINSVNRDAGGMVHAISYNGKRAGRVPLHMLEAVVSSQDLAHGFDPDRLHGHSVDPAETSETSPYHHSPRREASESEGISPASGWSGFPYGPHHGGGGASVTRLGSNPAYSSRPMSNASGRAGGLTRDDVNEAVTHHRISTEESRQKRAASPSRKGGCFTCWGGCCYGGVKNKEGQCC